jgi:hypothetical protein
MEKGGEKMEESNGRKEEYFRSLLREYLIENLPTDLDEFNEILATAKLWQLKGWREKIVYRSGSFSSKHLENLEEKIGDAIWTAKEEEIETVLEIGKKVNVKSRLGNQISRWLEKNFSKALQLEEKMEKLLAWSSKTNNHSQAANLIKNRILEILPSFLDKMILESGWILDNLEQLLKLQQNKILQCSEAQNLIKKAFVKTLSQLWISAESIERLIDWREKYHNSPFFLIFHEKLVRMLRDEYSLKNISIRLMIEWEKKIAKVTSNWGVNEELNQAINDNIIKLLDEIKVFELHLNIWLLRVVEGKMEIPDSLKLPLLKKIAILVEDKNLPDFSRMA